MAYRFIPLTFSGVTLYYLVNYALNVISHSNVEFLLQWFTHTHF